LDELNGCGHDGRLIGQGYTCVHVQGVSARSYLGNGIVSNSIIVSGSHLIGQLLSTSWIYTFANDLKRPVWAYDYRFRSGTNDRLCQYNLL
jgi:hypothetical protein